MFSIAAINDTNSKSQWEPLAPTKEAQEFHLSQTYHEGLLQLQAKDYIKARDLLESVLKDPLVVGAQVDGNASDGHLLQLRFLALKNLATVFVQQGSMHYESALSCYLQAVEIDSKDSVVWNQLGTLSCTMGLLSISRWAFEQGLVCSPNNWNCMEKLLEVLIAIGDEVSCLSVTELILRHWPSHSRALHVNKTIEESEPVPFVPRGIDKLKPKHVRLSFPEKRKPTDGNMDESVASKRYKQSIELHLAEASWAAIADGVLSILLSQNASEKSSEPGMGGSQDEPVVHESSHTLSKVLVGSVGGHIDGMQSTISHRQQEVRKLDRHCDVRITMHLPFNSENVTGSAEGKAMSNIQDGENGQFDNCVTGKSKTTKEKETCTDEEHSHERRSTRLERLRNRKPGKEELEFASNKNLAKVIFQFLEPFVIDKSGLQNSGFARSSPTADPDGAVYSSDLEHKDVTRFVKETSNNFGAYHLGHLLLETVACRSLPYQENFVKLLELEKLTRRWSQDRTTNCSLFLAELYYDFGSQSTPKTNSQFLHEASYHLCKVIELATLDFADNLLGNQDCGSRISEVEDSGQQNPSILCSDLTNKRHFWARFYWLSGRLSTSSGDKEKAYREFQTSLSLLSSCKGENDSLCFIPFPHCKLVKGLNMERVLHEIFLLQVDELLEIKMSSMIEKGMYLECVNLLAPLLLSTKDVYLDLLSSTCEEGKGVAFGELLALDFLISACEKATPMDVDAYLNCHRRKLQILIAGAGMVDFPSAHEALNRNSFLTTAGTSESEPLYNIAKHWNQLIADEVRAISQSVSLIKNYIDQNVSSVDVIVPTGVVGEVQSLILTVMGNVVGIFQHQKSCGLGTGNQSELESQCFIDSAIAFCKLQHLYPAIPIKAQVDLIVAIHELLAEHGLCCAGKDGEGEEGMFLKLAIKHFLVLDMKLKSSLHPPKRDLETKQSDAFASQGSHVKLITGSEPKASIDEKSSKVEKDVQVVEKDAPAEMNCNNPSTHEVLDKDNEKAESENGPCGNDRDEENASAEIVEGDDLSIDEEMETAQLAIDNALDQSFFCLYGLNLKSDSSDDDLAVHRNTSRGDYQSKEQCADVFQYVLPYAKASSRSGLAKLRRVLRAIRRHFPLPPEDVLKDNPIDKLLDDPNLNEDKLYELAVSDRSPDSIISVIFPNGRSLKTCRTSSIGSSEPYLEVYGNLYYLLSQAEEMSATDKWPGFVLTKEGEEFVEQNANLFKYDLLYNPLRFESWQRLANIFDEEVDLLLNDGSKHKNVVEWRKHAALSQRVEISRRRSRRCLLISLALTKNPTQQSEIHELLALVYYDSLQNVVPIYDQRSVIPTKDATWIFLCRNSMKHFKKALRLKPDWSYSFYLGKLCEKLRYPCKKAFSYYSKAANMNPSAVDPVYRMHASRLKLLYTSGKQDVDSLKVISAYSFTDATKEAIQNLFGWASSDPSQLPIVDNEDRNMPTDSEKEKSSPEPQQLREAWNILYNDCLSALHVCVEGELKHFHKARYMLAKGLYRRGESGDLEKAREELSFCFKSSRSSFTINMWEIDGMVKKARRKTPSLGGNKKGLEVSLSESSRKFITCIRKYILLYLNLLEETGDFQTLERAYTSLRTDRRFSLCLEDIVPVALASYIQALTVSIHLAEDHGSGNVEVLLERMFNLFMEHGSLWVDIGCLPELKKPELSETNLYSYTHRYIQSLERDGRLDMIEGINEKIRKRFKNPKLATSACSKICKHASLAWCRSILINLASITPLPAENSSTQAPTPVSGSDPSPMLYVDLQINELWNLSFEDPGHQKTLEKKWSHILSKMRNIQIKQALEENLEAAISLLRCTYNFYRESSCGTFPSGINLYTIQCHLATDRLCPPSKDNIDVLDLSVPRKLLLWAYTLVHGRYSNILVVVKHCEESMKSKIRKGSTASSAMSHTSTTTNTASIAAGAGKESSHDESSEADKTPPVAVPSAPLHGGSTCDSNVLSSSVDAQKTLSNAPPLHQCNSTNVERCIRDEPEGNKDMG